MLRKLYEILNWRNQITLRFLSFFDFNNNKQKSRFSYYFYIFRENWIKVVLFYKNLVNLIAKNLHLIGAGKMFIETNNQQTSFAYPLVSSQTLGPHKICPAIATSCDYFLLLPNNLKFSISILRALLHDFFRPPRCLLS